MNNKKEVGDKITIDQLAHMMNTSFEDMRKNFEDIRRNMATKDDILRIENRFERRIEILEDDVRVLKTTMSKK